MPASDWQLLCGYLSVCKDWSFFVSISPTICYAFRKCCVLAYISKVACVLEVREKSPGRWFYPVGGCVIYSFVLKSTELRRFAGLPVRARGRFAGHLPLRFAWGNICWIAIGRTRCALCAAGQNRRLFHYNRAANFQLRHALLEVARIEWSTSASSWEQGWSTQTVPVDSEGLKDGRHQCFKVGASICFSDVYVGSWYCDSPVACTSLRRCTNLLCWTLESDTATRRSPVRRFAGVPICCVERWNPIRRFAGNQFACVRRFAGVPICCVERWNLRRQLMVIDSPVYPIRRCTNL